MLIGQMLDLFVEDAWVLHEVDQDVQTAVNADEMGAPLRALRMVDVDAAEQSFRLGVTLKHPRCTRPTQ